MSASLRRSYWAKSDRKIPVSTPSKIKLCEFESLIRGQDKTLSTKVSAFENNFLFIPFLSQSIWYVRFCEGWYYENSCFVIDWVIKLCCTQKQERGQSGPYQDKWLMTGGLITLMSCNPLLDARMSLHCFQVVRFKDNSRTSLEISPRDAFLCFAGFLWADLICIRKEIGWNLLGKTEGKDFCNCGKTIGTLGE